MVDMQDQIKLNMLKERWEGISMVLEHEKAQRLIIRISFEEEDKEPARSTSRDDKFRSLGELDVESDTGRDSDGEQESNNDDLSGHYSTVQ